jgi:hypothetical protein
VLAAAARVARVLGLLAGLLAATLLLAGLVIAATLLLARLVLAAALLVLTALARILRVPWILWVLVHATLSICPSPIPNSGTASKTWIASKSSRLD